MLLPVYTFERQPAGIFPVLDGVTVEGGNVGQIVAGPSTQDNLPVVNLFNPSDADGYGSDTETDMIGLIDDTSTGTKNSGVGNSGMIGKLVEHPFDTSGTHIGPSSLFGSGKCTIWFGEGIYITDQFDGVDADTAPGTKLYSPSGVLSTTATGPFIGKVLKVFTGGLDNVTVRELLGTLPRVQPLPEDTTLMLFKFTPWAAGI